MRPEPALFGSLPKLVEIPNSYLDLAFRKGDLLTRIVNDSRLEY